MASSILDRTPLPLRILPGILALLILYLTISGPPHITMDIRAWHIIIAAMITLSITILLLNRGIMPRLVGRSVLPRSTPVISGELREHGSFGLAYRAFRIKGIGGEDPSQSISRIVTNRVSRGIAGYIIVSIGDKRRRGSYIIVYGDSSVSVDMESEVLLSMAEAVGGVRLEETSIPPTVVDSILLLGGEGNGDVIASIISEEGNGRIRRDYDIPLGSTLDTPTPMTVGLSRHDISAHVGIFGSTGSGKSTTASIISCGTWSRLRIPVMILDWMGEYRSILRCKARVLDPLKDGPKINPLALVEEPDLSAEIIGRALGLSWPQVYMLGNILESRGPSNVRDLIDEIEAAPEETRWDREVKRGLLRRIGLLARGQGLDLVTEGEPDPLTLDGVTVIDLSGIRLSLTRRAYALLLLATMYSNRLAKRSHPEPLLVVVDEAHNLFEPSEIPFTDHLIAESRKLGLWFMIVTQSPSSISNAVLLNTSTKIIHALKSSRDKSIIIDTVSLPQGYASLLDKLEPGEAVLVAPSLGEPLLVKVEFPQPPREGL